MPPVSAQLNEKDASMHSQPRELIVYISNGGITLNEIETVNTLLKDANNYEFI